MKEASGRDVMLTENGKEYLVEPTADQIDDLMDAEQLKQRSIGFPPRPRCSAPSKSTLADQGRDSQGGPEQHCRARGRSRVEPA